MEGLVPFVRHNLNVKYPLKSGGAPQRGPPKQALPLPSEDEFGRSIQLRRTVNLVYKCCIH